VSVEKWIEIAEDAVIDPTATGGFSDGLAEAAHIQEILSSIFFAEVGQVVHLRIGDEHGVSGEELGGPHQRDATGHRQDEGRIFASGEFGKSLARRHYLSSE
jgi:hypothetical protein